MNKEELIEFLKENLSVSVYLNSSSDFYSTGFEVTVSLQLENEIIASSSDSFALNHERY